MGEQDNAGGNAARRKRVFNADLFAGVFGNEFHAFNEWSVQRFAIGDTIVYEAFPQGSVAPADKVFFSRGVR